MAVANEYSRIGPEHGSFLDGLVHRNVFWTESVASDLYADHIMNMAPEESAQETNGQRESHGELWVLDQEKCKDGSNEALFQRTLMMSLISRHCLIYTTDPSSPRYLDFSVEELWSCPPIPTRAYALGEKFLT
jgi:hypothetical protein